MDFGPVPRSLRDAGPYRERSPVVAYFRDIWHLRHFWLALVRNDLRSRYRRSLFGLGWSLLQPMAMTGVLCLVFCQMFHLSLHDYAPFLLTGLTFWGFITSVVNQGCQCFFQGEPYIRQHRAPLAIYPLRTALTAGYHFGIGVAVVVVFVWCMNGLGNLPALLSLAVVLPLLFVFGWSVAVCAGTLNVLFQDTQHLAEILLQILFYMTPIMYPPSLLSEQHLQWIVRLNPFAILLELVREPLLAGRLPAPETVVMSVAVTLLTMAVASLMLKWCERRLVFYL